MGLTNTQKREAAELLANNYQLFLIPEFGEKFIDELNEPEKKFFQALKEKIPEELVGDLTQQCDENWDKTEEFFNVLYKNEPAIKLLKLSSRFEDMALLMEINYMRNRRNLRLGEAINNFLFDNPSSKEKMARYLRRSANPKIEGLLEFIYTNKDSNIIESSLNAYEEAMKKAKAPSPTPLGTFIINASTKITGRFTGAYDTIAKGAKSVRGLFH